MAKPPPPVQGGEGKGRRDEVVFRTHSLEKVLAFKPRSASEVNSLCTILKVFEPEETVMLPVVGYKETARLLHFNLETSQF